METSIEKHAGHSFLKAEAKSQTLAFREWPFSKTALLVYSVGMQNRTPAFPSLVQWNQPVAAFDVFSGKKWAEPSESISESLMVDLPHGSAFTYKVGLKVVSGEILWTAEGIVADTENRKSRRLV